MNKKISIKNILLTVLFVLISIVFCVNASFAYDDFEPISSPDGSGGRFSNLDPLPPLEIDKYVAAQDATYNAQLAETIRMGESQEKLDDLNAAKNASNPAADELARNIGHGIISDGVVGNVFAVNLMASQRVSDFLVLGNTLHCFAWHGVGAHDLRLMGIKITKFPSLSIGIVGLGLMLLGAILVIVIGYYLVDISFKLGFCVMALPIAIALWPFPKIGNKLNVVITTMFHAAGILIFLALGVAYLWALFDAVFAIITVTTDAGEQKQGVEAIYEFIRAGEPKPLREAFKLSSINILLLMFAGLYGFQLIGKLATEYADKFFPDGMGTGSPMHHQLTKATGFAKNIAMKPVNYAKDVVKTQVKRGLAKGYGALGGKIGALGKTTFGKAVFKSLGGSMVKRAMDFEDHYQELGKPKEKEK